MSEIVFQPKSTQKIDDKKAIIKLSIKEIGFENAANLHSIADSRKFGGNIGWVDEKSLTIKILDKINNLNIGDYSEAITSGNNYLILKVENIKEEKTKVNKDVEMSKMISFERNRQLNKFSNIYFNKIRINTVINDL